MCMNRYRLYSNNRTFYGYVAQPLYRRTDRVHCNEVATKDKICQFQSVCQRRVVNAVSTSTGCLLFKIVRSRELTASKVLKDANGIKFYKQKTSYLLVLELPGFRGFHYQTRAQEEWLQ